MDRYRRGSRRGAGILPVQAQQLQALKSAHHSPRNRLATIVSPDARHGPHGNAWREDSVETALETAPRERSY